MPCEIVDRDIDATCGDQLSERCRKQVKIERLRFVEIGHPFVGSVRFGTIESIQFQNQGRLAPVNDVRLFHQRLSQRCLAATAASRNADEHRFEIQLIH